MAAAGLNQTLIRQKGRKVDYASTVWEEIFKNKCPRGCMSLRDDMKREQIGKKLEGCVSIELYFLIVEGVVVLSIRDNLT